MKKFTFLLMLLPFFAQSQEHICSKVKQRSLSQQLNLQAKAANVSSLTSHEFKYDVKFVHLNLNLERDTTYIIGNVKTVATVIAPLDTFMTSLHLNLVIDSIRFNGALLPAIRIDSTVKVKIPATLATGSSFTVIVYYKGTPPSGGSAIGSAFDTDIDPIYANNCTWSLSEPFGAYHWWPCKQLLTDKIDSSWVFVTTDSTNKVGSNGLLKNIVTVGNKKRYEWKSLTPIDYYLISVAVSNYKEYNLYAKPQYLLNDSILIQNYIYGSAINDPFWLSNEKPELDKMPQIIKLYSNLFGMYPFYKEKYGHCMAPFGGGMEHQTMTSLGFFLSFDLNAHELGHQWWGDNVTCKSWKDIMINEGFATYTEFLALQYLDPINMAARINDAHNFVMGQPGGSCYFTNQDTLKSNVIFDSRLTYNKGGSIIRTLQFLTNNDSVWFATLRGFQNTYKNTTASVIDFRNYYQSQTGINATQFFNQWYYGEGYPTFHVNYNYSGNTCVLSCTQTVSKSSVTPLFITPIEYRIKRIGFPDTIVRVMHSNPTELYTFNLQGTVTGVFCDPNNWVINKATFAIRDTTISNSIKLTQLGQSDIKISPNPSRGIFNVNNPSNLPGSLMVWDLGGKIILQKNLEENTTIDLTRFSNGLYELRVIGKDQELMFSQKIIKE